MQQIPASGPLLSLPIDDSFMDPACDTKEGPRAGNSARGPFISLRQHPLHHGILSLAEVLNIQVDERVGLDAGPLLSFHPFRPKKELVSEPQYAKNKGEKYEILSFGGCALTGRFAFQQNIDKPPKRMLIYNF